MALPPGESRRRYEYSNRNSLWYTRVHHAFAAYRNALVTRYSLKGLSVSRLVTHLNRILLRLLSPSWPPASFRSDATCCIHTS